MRKICEYCKASLYNDYCEGDDEQCIKVMRYDMGYNYAVEKAAEWLENALNGENIEGCKDSKQLIDDFKRELSYEKSNTNRN